MKIMPIKSGCSLLEAEEIAAIHACAYSNTHFTSGFPLKKLALYNQILIKYSDLAFFVVESGRVVGFVIAGTNLSAGVNKFVRQNFFWLILHIVRRPKIFIDKTFSFLQSKFKTTRASQATFRLLSIAVSPEVQSKGIGLKMLVFLERELLIRNITCYGLSVKNNNLRAIGFYERNGFVLEQKSLGSSYYLKFL
jgi:ribosomal protein S18 acetylase RimI-like enzyme